MAPEFRLNLIRAQVPSLQRRRARYGSMVAYLAVSGALLALVVGLSTTWLVQAAAGRADIAALDRGFAARHVARPGIVQHAAWVENEMGGRIAVLRAVDRQLAGRPRLGSLLYRLARSLPFDIGLKSLTIDANAETVAFELLVPAVHAEAGLGPSDLVAQWNQDAALNGYVTGIAYVSSQRQSNGERSDLVWRFSGHLTKRES